MRKIVLAVGLIFSTLAYADHVSNSVAAYNAIVPCAAYMVGETPTTMDITRPAGQFLGSTPGEYQSCVVPKLKQEGFKAPTISLYIWQTKYDLESVSLADFIADIADQLQPAGTVAFQNLNLVSESCEPHGFFCERPSDQCCGAPANYCQTHSECPGEIFH